MAPSVELVFAGAADTSTPLVPRTPPERPSKSYADSPCSAKSMPSTSSSSLTRHPIVYLMAKPIKAVKKPVQTIEIPAAPAW